MDTKQGSSVGNAARALLVTRDSRPGDTAWADVAASAEEALRLWRRVRHPHVIADFGRLPCGSTGTQLARQMRAEDSAVLLFLLSSEVHPAQTLWARRNGAFAVVPRSRESMAACLSGWTLQACRTGQAHAGPLDHATQAARQSIVSALLSVGRLSAETLCAVEDAIAALRACERPALHQAPGALAGTIARTIARRMGPQALRADLLQLVSAAAQAAAHPPRH